MDNFVIYEELASCNPTCLHYKGRRRGSINFVSIEKYEKKEKDLVSNAVHLSHSLRHDNVREFLEWYETPKHIWIISKLCSGGTLNDVLEQDGCLPEPVVWTFLFQLASGLFHLHDSGILYCDLRPVKILLDSSGTLKFGDFTKARFLRCVDPPHMDNDKSKKTPVEKTESREPSVCLNDSVPEVRPHTPGAFLPSTEPVNEVQSQDIPLPFLSPECRRGEIPSVSSDIWGLGCLLYSLYCGYPPQESSEHLHKAEQKSVFELPGKNQVDGCPPSPEFTLLLTGLLETSPPTRISWKGLLTVLDHQNTQH